MLSSWLRAIRIRFLLASIIAVSTGLAISWWTGNSITIFDAVLTFLGVLALHASVDLLNDYWDFKRGIDSKTVKTKMSGGSGVLPEGLLDPKHVYRAGIIFLIIGALIGTYFVVTDGVIIGVILAFAILSIYFYSTKIVNWGLAEVFVAIKGTLIVIGTCYIQTSQINESMVLGGIVVGVLSSFVLFITSFPDYDIDKEIKSCKANPQELDTCLKELFSCLNESGREIIIKVAYWVSIADDEVDKKEEKLLIKMAKHFQMSSAHLKGIISEVNEVVSGPD